jgi:outer membrane lipoprotein-sorting protein
MRRTIVLIALLVSSLLLGACAERLPTADEIVAKMEAARASTQDVHATVAIDFTSPDQSGSMVIEAWMQKLPDAADGEPKARVRAEVREASQAELVGSLLVSDGEQFWLYSPSNNTVVVGTADEMKKQSPTSPAGATQMLQDVVQQGLDAVNLEVLGEEQVAGKNTWKVKVTPKPETTANLQLAGVIEGTMWVDEALAMPLKLTVDASDFGSGTVEARSIEVNAGVSADLFTYTPPAGATIVQAADLAAQMAPKAATLEEARSSVSFTLREPSYLPAGLALVEVRVVGTGTVILNYGGDGASMSLVQSNEDVGDGREPPAGSDVKQITVRGQPATLIVGADGQGSLLTWDEGGIKTMIAGTISGDEAVKVAEGLK